MKFERTAQLCRAAREKSGLSRERFAARLWTPKRTVARWEDGDSEPVGAVQILMHEIIAGRMPKERELPK